MEIFWTHLNSAKDKFETEFYHHQKDVEAELRSFKAKLDKNGYGVDTVYYALK